MKSTDYTGLLPPGPRSPDYNNLSVAGGGGVGIDPSAIIDHNSTTAGLVTVTVNGGGTATAVHPTSAPPVTTNHNHQDGNIFNFQTAVAADCGGNVSSSNNALTVERRPVRRLSPIPPTAAFPTVIEEPATPCYDDSDAAMVKDFVAGGNCNVISAGGVIMSGGGMVRKEEKEMNGSATDVYAKQPRRRLPSINANMVKNMPSRSFDSGNDISLNHIFSNL